MKRINQGRNHSLGGGVIAGVIGGAVVATLMLIGALAQGQDIWIGMKGAGAPFLRERAMAPGFDAAAVTLGIICQFAVSIVWGVLFAAIFSGLSRGATVVAGALWGIVVWLGMFYIVLPVLGLSQMAKAEPVSMAIVSHVVFGLAVGIGFLPFQHPRRHAHPPITHARASL